MMFFSSRKIILFLCLAVLLLPSLGLASGLTVHFMDIGRNDGILIECDGESAFIDSGTYDYGQLAISYMQSQGIEHLKYYIGSHAHRDHVGGGGPIILAMQAETLLQPHEGVQRQIIANCKKDAEIAAVSNIPVITATVGETYSIGSAELLVLGPLSINPGDSRSDHENDNSLVCRLTYGDHTFLLTGDCPTDVMARIEEATPGCLRCTVLKNPHHNSQLDRSVLFACAPQYVVYSTSDNAQPTLSALQNVSEVGALAMITAPKVNSTIVFHSDRTELTYALARTPQSLAFIDSEMSIYVGQKKACRAIATPSQYKAITYSSDDPGIAFIEGDSGLFALSPGTTTVHASIAGSLTADCTVTVLPYSVKLSKNTRTLKVGTNDTIRYSLVPTDVKGMTVTWTIDDPEIATVNEKGRIDAISPGTTTLHAILSNGEEDTCEIIVQ